MPEGALTSAIETERIAFVDIEASSLGSGSFITEIGWAWISDRRVHTGSCLIKPLPRWLRESTAWDPDAERLTGITKDQLERDGVSPTEAAMRIVRELGDRQLFSGEPAFDQYWLNQLFEAAGADRDAPKLGDAKKLFAEVADEHPNPKAALAEAERAASLFVVARHRAEPDTRRLALTYSRLVHGVL
jgi:DNA polymerase III epsilon subunit-like protein